MGLAAVVKSYGFESVADVTFMINKCENTLRSWLQENPDLLHAVLLGLSVRRLNTLR
jgi:hypothetical protein